MTIKNHRFEAPLTASSVGLDRALLNIGVSQENLAKAKSQNFNFKVIQTLAELGVINQTELLEKLSRSLSLELVGLDNLLAVDPELLAKTTLSKALQLRCFPFKKSGESVVFALADPLDNEAISALSFDVGSSIKIVVASEDDILAAIFQMLLGSSIQHEDADELEIVTRIAESSARLPVVKFDAPLKTFETQEGKETIRIVNKILFDAIKLDASDVHIEPSQKSLEVRFRLNGVLCPHLTLSKEQQSYVISRIKVLAEMDTADSRHPQDGRFRIKKHDVVLRDVRISSVPTAYGEKLLLRFLNTEEQQISFDWIGMPLDLENEIKHQLSLVDKMLLISGPTGAGKSTTLYACICHLKQKGGNIVTVEDPIEYRIEGVTQIEVNERAKLGFADGLRSVLRQDPDVIMVGEVRDAETAMIAVQAAQTGHLVLSSLHTNDASSAIIRLVDLGIERYLIAASVGAVLAQRLVRKICDHCAIEIKSPEMIAEARLFALNPKRMREPVGCKECFNTGFAERIGIFSLLNVTPRVREAIRNGGNEQEIAHIASSEGMVSLVNQARKMIEEGLTTVNEVKRVLGVVREEDNSVSSSNPRVISNNNSRGLLPLEKDDFKESLTDLVSRFDSESLRQPKVLLVDDEDSLRLILGKKLTLEHYEVVAVRNAREALEQLTQITPDVIIVDLMMPEIDGHQLVRMIREKDSIANIPIMMLTNVGDDAQEVVALSSGVNDYVYKTSSVKVIVARLNKLLKQSGFKFTS